MVTDGPFGMSGVIDYRKGRRRGATYPNQFPLGENNHQSRPPPSNYRPIAAFRGGILTAPPHAPNRPMHHELNRHRNEFGRIQQERFRPNGWVGSQGRASTKRPQFQAVYLEFEKMKRMGFVLTAEPKEEVILSQECVQPIAPKANKCGTTSEDFAEAMRIFMKSYLPISSFPITKPVDDWSKEAGNLLNELTDKESQSDADTSVWKIPKDGGKFCSGAASSGDAKESSWSTTPSKSFERDTGKDTFDIHRHIMEIKPSPYPGGSPISSDQLSSNPSSDNDADDEGTLSSAESTCSKAIGAKKSLKRRLHSSFACLTMDSGYLSSANESDGVWKSASSRFPGTTFDSDVSSECGFTSSSGPSRPTSPPMAMLVEHGKSAEDWVTVGQRHISLATSRVAVHRTTNQKPAPAIPVTCPPIPPPIPQFLTTVAAIPMPPPPHFLPGHIHSVGTVAQTSMASMSRLPRATGLTIMGPTHPLAFAPQLQIKPAQTIIGESLPQDALASNGAYHKHKAWITDEILEMIAVRDRLYKRMKKHPAPDIVEMYKKVRNMVVGMTRNAKRSYEKQYEEQQMEQRLRNLRCGGNRSTNKILIPHRAQKPW